MKILFFVLLMLMSYTVNAVPKNKPQLKYEAWTPCEGFLHINLETDLCIPLYIDEQSVEPFDTLHVQFMDDGMVNFRTSFLKDSTNAVIMNRGYSRKHDKKSVRIGSVGAYPRLAFSVIKHKGDIWKVALHGNDKTMQNTTAVIRCDTTLVNLNPTWVVEGRPFMRDSDKLFNFVSWNRYLTSGIFYCIDENTTLYKKPNGRKIKSEVWSADKEPFKSSCFRIVDVQGYWVQIGGLGEESGVYGWIRWMNERGISIGRAIFTY